MCQCFVNSGPVGAKSCVKDLSSSQCTIDKLVIVCTSAHTLSGGPKQINSVKRKTEFTYFNFMRVKCNLKKLHFISMGAAKWTWLHCQHNGIIYIYIYIFSTFIYGQLLLKTKSVEDARRICWIVINAVNTIVSKVAKDIFIFRIVSLIWL